MSEPAPAPAMVSFTGFNVSNDNGVNYVQGIDEGTTVSDLISNTNGGDAEIYKGDEVVDVDQNLATGMEVKVKTDSGTETYEVVVTGDINGDAMVGDSDLLMMARFMVGCGKESEMVQGPYLKATDMDFDEENATDKDLLRLARNLVE